MLISCSHWGMYEGTEREAVWAGYVRWFLDTHWTVKEHHSGRPI